MQFEFGVRLMQFRLCRCVRWRIEQDVRALTRRSRTRVDLSRWERRRGRLNVVLFGILLDDRESMRIMIFGNHRRLAGLRAAALGIIILFLTFGITFLFSSGLARAGIADAVKSQTLPNRLKVLVLENHKAPLATFNVFFRVGSRNEQMGKTGLSHLCEHLMFKGTKTIKPEEFSQIIQQNGGMDNAFTESDFTDYFETINKDHLDVPIRLEAGLMANFEPKDFDQEKHVVLAGRRAGHH